MAIKLPKMFTGTDARTRIFLVVAVIVGLSVVIFFAVNFLSGGAATGPTQVATAPSTLQTVPGGAMTPEFYQAVVQANTQAAKQAQISGGSAIPTIVNIPGQQGGFPEQNCTILCPGDEAANVASDINDLVKKGKLSQEDANKLLNLAQNNATEEEYAAALDELVRQGKLTPEQARALLEKYKKQRANALVNESAKAMDAMIKSGQLPLDTATQLLSLQKRNLTPAEYAAELNRLVREGKLSPAAAAQLLAQYTQQQMREQAKKGAYGLQQMAKAGEITADVANSLAAMQAKNVPVNEYAATLDRLVASGKLTPAAAARLLDQYKKQRAEIGPAGTLNAIVGQEESRARAVLADMVANGKLPQDVANALSTLQQKEVSPEEYQRALGQLVQSKKLSPEDAQKLLASYQKLAAVRGQVKRLAAMQGNNVEDYTAELKKAVQAGLLTPEMAATLLAQYRALNAPGTIPGAGITPGIEANIPGGAEFAQLQQRLQAETPPPPGEEVQFATVSPAEVPVQTEAQAQAQAEALAAAVAAKAAADEARKQRIEQLQAAMSSQAQSLIAAWQPPVMQHKEGAAEKTKEGAEGSSSSKESSTATKKALEPALIKAGTILFAILDTAVDSDYPDTPVMATIVMGNLKGAKLLGKLNLQQDKDRVSLNFTLMDREGWPSAKSVNAFAIDPDTARTVMASSVDYHYLKRYGSIMGTAFLTGYSNAITQQGTATTGIFGTSSTHPSLSPGNKLAVGLGQVGTTLGASIANYINTPTTVRVNSGVGIGVLFMGEVREGA